MTIRKHAEQKIQRVFLLFCLFFIVGDGAPDVPLIDVSVSISFVFFYTMFGAKIYNIVCFFSLVTNPSPAASMSGCRGRQPLHICVYSLSAAKSLSLFADFTLYKKLQKQCRDLFSDIALFWVTTLYFFFYYSAPLSRLAPIEALPQAPTGLCPFLVSEVEQEIYSQGVSPLDPDQGRAPGPFARFARCFFYFIFIIFSFSFDPCCVDIFQVFQILFL